MVWRLGSCCGAVMVAAACGSPSPPAPAQRIPAKEPGSAAAPASDGAVSPPDAPPVPLGPTDDVRRITFTTSRTTLGGNAAPPPRAITSDGHGFSGNGHAIPQEHVAALVGALTHLHESDGLLECISHTDDYPDVVVTIERAGGNVTFSSASNCQDLVPWNVVMNGRLYAQYDGTAGRAIRTLALDLDPDSELGGYAEGGAFFDRAMVKPAPRGVAALALERDRVAALVMGDRRVADLLGSNRAISEVSIWCGAADDCRARKVTLNVRWNARVLLEVIATLDGDTVNEIRFDKAHLDATKAFVDSKIARSLPVPRDCPILARFDDPKECKGTPASCLTVQLLGWKDRDGRWCSSMSIELQGATSQVYVANRDVWDDPNFQHVASPVLVKALARLGNKPADFAHALADEGALFTLDGKYVGPWTAPAASP